jgi:Dolichyl-phosphate-mannose-protein mannosyltransferase
MNKDQQDNQAGIKWIAYALILGSGLLHLVYLLFFCPLNLAPDEAHYWDWSRHLDWSYYSKGPLVSWLIRMGREVFGPLSIALCGSEMPAVRFPAVICGTLLIWGIFVLTLKATSNARASLAAVIIAISLPPIAAASSLITIDAPYTCAWIWSLVFGYMALFEDKSWAWFAAGAAVGLGILAKYTMILWIGSLACFFLFTPQYRIYFLKPGPWILGFTAAFFSLPILIWNIQNNWVSFHHVSALAGMHQGPRIQWMGPLTYLGQQFGLLLGYWFILWAWAMWHFRPWLQENAVKQYLWWMSAITFLVFFGFSPKTGGGEMNWPVTAYLSGLVLIIFHMQEILAGQNPFLLKCCKFFVPSFIALGLAISLFMHQSEWIRPLFLLIAENPSKANPFPLRKFDPTCRLRGWVSVAKEIDKLRADITFSTGREPVLAGGSWNVPGEVGFYCTGHPQAYSIGLVNGDRHSQYDLWQNPIDHPEAFLGKDFLVIGIVSPKARKAFESVEELPSFWYYENGQPISVWQFQFCKGFKGFKVEGSPGHF